MYEIRYLDTTILNTNYKSYFFTAHPKDVFTSEYVLASVYCTPSGQDERASENVHFKDIVVSVTSEIQK